MSTRATPPLSPSPSRYGLAVVVLLLSACASPPAPRAPQAQAPLQFQTQPQPRNATLSPGQQQELLLMAMAMLDRNYSYGGKHLHTGFDCSGFVSFVYRQSAGVLLRGSAADMAKQTSAVEVASALPGDLVFFNTLGPAFSHVGIYIGDGKFIHAENERTGVRISRLDASYWSSRFEGFRAY
jgi:cell wall-associated NlpC family hydrolase